jgi:transposase
LPRKRLSMRKIKELLRLKFECDLNTRQIATSLCIAVGSVHDYLARVRIAGLKWPLPDSMSEQELEALLFPAPVSPGSDTRPLPDWDKIDIELKRKGLTLRLLWEEYRTDYPEGLGYSQFCKRFDDFKQTLDPRMHQSHKAGEKLFVDYAGPTLPLTDRVTGEIHDAQIFVATQGASSYTYAEATLTQSIPDWIGSHIRAFEFFGGVTELLVCDHLRTGVNTSCPFEPDIQRTYEDMAAHYGTAVLPARIVSPRDKGKVESGVQSVEERVLAPLRNRQFFSLFDMNQAIRPLVAAMNQRKMQNRDHSRQDLFAQLDRPALRPLPLRRHEIGLWSHARVSVDYHISVSDRFYSVPYRLLKLQVDARTSGDVVEIFHKGERVASHIRVSQKYGYSTQNEHMPETHKTYADWTPERVLAWLQQTGEATRSVGEAILASRPHPQQGFRACFGLVRLSAQFGIGRVEAASRKAIAISSPSYTSVKAILKNNMDRLPDMPAEPAIAPIRHSNERGSKYYHLPKLQADSADTHTND